MVKCAKENRIIILAFTIFLFFALTISSGGRKKEQSEEARQAVPEEKTKHVSASEQTGMAEKIDLRVLYIGLPDTERAKDFMEFLSRNFEKVGNIDKKTFDEHKTAEFDVIVIDEIINISREYSRPTVTIGIAGTKIGDYLDLKTGYL